MEAEQKPTKDVTTGRTDGSASTEESATASVAGSAERNTSASRAATCCGADALPSSRAVLARNVSESPDQSAETLVARLAATKAELERTRSEYAAYRESVQRTLALILPEKPFVIAFEALRRGYTTVRDTQIVRDMCQRVNGPQWDAIFESFYQAVLYYRELRPSSLVQRDADLPQDWFREPWYCLYPQFMGTEQDDVLAKVHSFRDLIDLLPYWEALGIRNLSLLPHYDSDWADGGYDVRAYRPHPALGGLEAFQEFVSAATQRGFRLMTEAIFSHTATDHEWFQRALRGESRYLRYYLRRDGREKIGEYERNGEVICRYRDPDGTITERICLFPDIDRTHGLWVQVKRQNGSVASEKNETSTETVQFYRTFLPFQVDLNLQNPDVLQEFFHLLGEELQLGILGKRIDAVAHWVKRPGTPGDGLPETHTLLALFKSFIHHLCPRAVLMPEAVRPNHIASQYAGIGTELCGNTRSSEGDLVLCFELQAALREMLWFRRTAPWWRVVLQLPKLPAGADWCVPFAHHDDIYLGFFEPSVRADAVQWIRTCGGLVYRGGISAACSEYDLLARDPRRLGLAFFILLVGVGTPFLYQGLELGMSSSFDYARLQMQRRYERLKKCGVLVAEGACMDPRDLHRGPIPRALLWEALEQSEAQGYQVPTRLGFGVAILRQLNALRSARPSLRSGSIQPIDTGRAEIIAFIRHHGSRDGPLLCAANLSDSEVEMVTPSWQLGAYLGTNTATDLVCSDLLRDAGTFAVPDGEREASGAQKRLRLQGTGYVLRLEPLAMQILEPSKPTRQK
ncbi:similar to trehalose synthase [Cyanidioschyzon merolae strain 10D]|uniref:Similar to trehalose synthase n=1 Tax=Cyanidioschyzon merolae (strain NIES-3377 / 10D) TaxID=280699 RepID=M1VA57_CYAM1|nr:similar to trehalose synthase [Cyanidioschyzon merolae strain 10D]BAM78952.1 similar to trehalose synthase [Cyanidioschyzon merolae strain 10D]|eukprot:XP_005535238.1 similar to trehalose synthase [Cyanidioschyzon merolae strain 10D]